MTKTVRTKNVRNPLETKNVRTSGGTRRRPNFFGKFNTSSKSLNDAQSKRKQRAVNVEMVQPQSTSVIEIASNSGAAHEQENISPVIGRVSTIDPRLRYFADMSIPKSNYENTMTVYEAELNHNSD